MTVKEKLSFFVNHGVTIKYIAERMGVETSTLSKWLHDQKVSLIKMKIYLNSL